MRPKAERAATDVRLRATRHRRAAPARPRRLSPRATKKYGDFMFAGGRPRPAERRRGQATLVRRRRRVEADRSRARDEPFVVGGRARRHEVGRVRLATRGRPRVRRSTLRAGADTSEWAHDRADIRARVRHKRAAVASSYAGRGRARGIRGAHLRHLLRAARARRASRAARSTLAVTPKWPDLLLSRLPRLARGRAAARRTPAPRVVQRRAGRARAAARRREARGRSASPRPPEVELRKRTRRRARTPRAGVCVGQTAREEVYENSALRCRARGSRRTCARSTRRRRSKVIRTGLLARRLEWEPERTALVESGVADAESRRRDARKRERGGHAPRAEPRGREDEGRRRVAARARRKSLPGLARVPRRASRRACSASTTTCAASSSRRASTR